MKTVTKIAGKHLWTMNEYVSHGDNGIVSWNIIRERKDAKDGRNGRCHMAQIYDEARAKEFFAAVGEKTKRQTIGEWQEERSRVGL